MNKAKIQRIADRLDALVKEVEAIKDFETGPDGEISNATTKSLYDLIDALETARWIARHSYSEILSW